MKRVLCVLTCHKFSYAQGDTGMAHHNGEQKARTSAARETWYKIWKQKYQSEVDVKFFFGQPPDDRKPGENEVFLDCPDDYPNLPLKTKAIFKWCVENGYDYAAKLDDDVYVYVGKILKEFNPKDYQGYSNGWFISGAFYWLSRRAMEIVANAPWSPDQWAEDQFVGRTLAPHGILPEHDERFQVCYCDICCKKYPKDARLTQHTNKPEQMFALFQEENF